jgi:hypothetical protein
MEIMAQLFGIAAPAARLGDVFLDRGQGLVRDFEHF